MEDLDDNKEELKTYQTSPIRLCLTIIKYYMGEEGETHTYTYT